MVPIILYANFICLFKCHPCSGKQKQSERWVMLDVITFTVEFCSNKARCPSVLIFYIEHLWDGMTVITARLPSYEEVEPINVSLPCHRQWFNLQTLDAYHFRGYVHAPLTLRIQKDVEAYSGPADCAFLSLRPSKEEPNRHPDSLGEHASMHSGYLSLLTDLLQLRELQILKLNFSRFRLIDEIPHMSMLPFSYATGYS